ncbi:hypothetical protein [Bradyrhizobium neotropicale]|uniref:hypothetical protein n=1 Tax=Bradyrhizobium neotropicale TaxID=1497615 RepID=UPI001FED8CDC|nr:hypothetical protein [Bradyrhizobium neotropicale]
MMLAAIATIIFGAALLIQGGTMLTEFTKMTAPPGTAEAFVGEGGHSALFLVGAAGIVLGVLSLIGIAPLTLTGAAIIAFGSALLLSSTSVWRLYRAKQASYRAGAIRTSSGAEFLAGEMAASSAVLQSVSGLAAIVLGILAATGTNSSMLTLVGLLVLEATVLLTGSTLSGAVMGFMEPAVTRSGEALSRQLSGTAE